MQKPKITKLNFTYKRDDGDVWVLNLDDVPIDKNLIKDQQIVYFGPESVGGNHKHPRVEWFIGVGDLSLIWIDENGEKHEESMNPDDQLLLIEIPTFLPHAVKNNSDSKQAFLFEYANAKMEKAETIKIV